MLTLNIERIARSGWRAEGVVHRRFILEEGRLYPSEDNWTDGRGADQLHGGSDRLLLDERLDQPVEKETLERFTDVFPEDAVLLVVGCGGRDRRVMDLIERGVLEGRKRGKETDRQVVWLHHEDRPASSRGVEG